MQLIVEPNEYLNRNWPEFWLTHANLDKLWAAGIPMKWRTHDGLTHMKTLVTSAYATNASSNYSAGWQRDHDYFVAAATKPMIYQAIKDRVTAMWNNSTDFTNFYPLPPDAATLVAPASGATGVSTTPTLVWGIAPFAVSYDVYLGNASTGLVLVANVPAQLTNNPPSTYSWTPSSPLQPGTTYDWQIFSRTFATDVDPTLQTSAGAQSFTTAAGGGPPPPPSNPNPADGATGVGTAPTLSWASPGATTYDVSFGTSNPPPVVSSGQTAASYAPGSLNAVTQYYWQVVAYNSSGSTPGPVWSFTTAASTPTDIVIYASDIPPPSVHGTWFFESDATAAAGVKLATPDNGVPAIDPPLASPDNFVDVTFNPSAGTPYTLWLRLQALDNSKLNDSVWVQFSDATVGGAQAYPTGTTSGLLVNLGMTSDDFPDDGWGWQNTAYWLTQATTLSFATSGVQTMRVQIREDGVEFDQIVLSPGTYLNAPPGPVKGDQTIVPKP
jgi:hypothetical protein